ncbi:MAG TPA: SLC13 family permease [Candidatus Limnocylindria bacterium]
MSAEVTMAVAAAVVAGTLVAMASRRVPPVLALAGGLTLAGILGLATVEELLAGLANPGIITIGAMLVLAKGIVQTGVVTRLTWALLSTARNARQALRRLMVPIGLASAVMNTTPLVAMLIPATRELEQTRRIPAREVLLPIAHVTTLAGSVTLIGTSSNLLIAGIAAGQGIEMGMLSYAPVALPTALVGWLVIYLVAPVFLRGRVATEQPAREWRVEIPVTTHALITGRQASAEGVARTQEYELVAIQRRGKALDPDGEIDPDDVLTFSATEAGVTALWRSPLFGLSPQRLYATTIKLAGSQTLRDLESESLRVVAAQTNRPLRDTVPVPGDTCFITTDDVDEIGRNEAFALWQPAAGRVPQPGNTWIAVGIMGAVIAAATLGLLPIVLAAVAGAVLMVLTGVLTPGSAGRALDWNVLFVLAGSVGLGAIVVSSGLADLIADGVRLASGGSELLFVIAFAAITTAMTNVITNAAAASIITPVGIAIAREYGIDPTVVLALIGTCISFTFLNPFGHQTNMMVLRPGGYTTATFLRFGTPVLLAALVTAAVVAYLLIRTSVLG